MASSAMVVAVLVCASLVLSVSDAIAVPVSPQAVTAAKTALTTLFTQNPDAIPGIVRLNFHDCVGGCDGCINPSLAANNGLAGIVSQLEAIYPGAAVMSRADFWALGGIVALQLVGPPPPPAGVPNPLPLPFMWGRQDCATAPTTTAGQASDYPNGMGNMDEVKRIFVNGEFQLTVAQTVALLGAHSLGKAVTANSGFHGPWAPPTNRFSNKFFVNLLNNKYSHSNNGPNSGGTQQFNSALAGPPPARRGLPPPPGGQPPPPGGQLPPTGSPPPKQPPPSTKPPPMSSQPRSTQPPPTTKLPTTQPPQPPATIQPPPRPIFMLHTDMALKKNFPVAVDGSGAITGVAPGCVVSDNSVPGTFDSVATCPDQSSTIALVTQFAANNTAFLIAFNDAFTRMCAHSSGVGAQYTLYPPTNPPAPSANQAGAPSGDSSSSSDSSGSGSSSGSSLSGPAVVGILAGCVVCLALVAAVAVRAIKKRAPVAPVVAEIQMAAVGVMHERESITFAPAVVVA